MGFFSNIISSAVKVVISPVAIVVDVVSVVKSDEPNATKNLLESAGKDACDAMDDLTHT